MYCIRLSTEGISALFSSFYIEAIYGSYHRYQIGRSGFYGCVQGTRSDHLQSLSAWQQVPKLHAANAANAAAAVAKRRFFCKGS